MFKIGEAGIFSVEKIERLETQGLETPRRKEN